MTLVLSLFPGIGLLDRAFEEEGFTGGCSWLYVDYELGYGFCSGCPATYRLLEALDLRGDGPAS